MNDQRNVANLHIEVHRTEFVFTLRPKWVLRRAAHVGYLCFCGEQLFD